MEDIQKDVLTIETSAPAKIILFGEHSVVYGAPAIAASIDRRTYVTLKFNNSKVFRIRSSALNLDVSISFPVPQEDLQNPNLSQPQSQCLKGVLIAYNSVQESLKNFGIDLIVNSDFPLSAGLGSSGSFSVALVTAFLAAESFMTNKNKFMFSDSEKCDLNKNFLIDVQNLAHKIESVYHGNPSGIDTAVSTLGGIIRFQKGDTPKKVAENLKMKVAIVDSKVERNTATLVGLVRDLKQRLESPVAAVLEAMKAVTESALEEIANPTSVKTFLDLVRINHGLLCALGVSHSVLDKIGLSVVELEVGFKLTGAGGGGNALIFIPDYVPENDIVAKINSIGLEANIVSIGTPGIELTIGNT